jgi:hypothetical protein
MTRTNATDNRKNVCHRHGEPVFKNLRGSYTIDGVKYAYNVCPVCYPAHMNVHHMLRDLHERAMRRSSRR